MSAKGNKTDLNNKGGRPKKEIDLLPCGWALDIIELYRFGASDVEVKAIIYDWMGTFSNNLWDRWMDEEEQFWETIKKGRMLSEAWWNKEGRINLKDKDFNYTGWYMQMKNRFGWVDRTENKSKNTNENTIVWKEEKTYEAKPKTDTGD